MVDAVADVEAEKQYESSEAGSRDTLLELTLALLGKLEIPSEFLQRTFWAEPCKSGIIRTCIGQKIFQHLSNATDGLKTEELAAKTGEPWDLRMLQRLMSHLAVMHVIVLSQDRCPKTDIDGPFQYAWKTDLPFFPWLQAHPPNLTNFAQFISAYRAGKPSWFDPGFYPVTERIINGFDANYSDVLLCDVGGGRGHDMLGFASQYPSLPDKIVLQDQPTVVASIEVTDPPFEARAHDFFTPQPVKSRAYSLHSIPHDWSDDEGVRILESLKPALKPGYSRVLLFEIVVSGDEPSFASTTMDMQMLAHVTAGEGTEKDWKHLIGRAGFEVLEIFTYPGVAESVIKLVLTSQSGGNL
ncbi:hypothetical protein SCUP515_11731 [Seiridium cupressi]